MDTFVAFTVFFFSLSIHCLDCSTRPFVLLPAPPRPARWLVPCMPLASFCPCKTLEGEPVLYSPWFPELICPLEPTSSLLSPVLLCSVGPKNLCQACLSAPIAWDVVSRTIRWIQPISQESPEFRNGGDIVFFWQRRNRPVRQAKAPLI